MLVPQRAPLLTDCFISVLFLLLPSSSQELCRAAVMVPVRELMPYARGNSLSTLELDDITVEKCRPVEMSDFLTVFERIKPTGGWGMIRGG